MSFAEHYRLLSGSIIPRPIAFVSTFNANGTVNAAPFSSFMIASVEAGYLAFCVGPRERPKDTLRNIRRSGEFVINTVPEDWRGRSRSAAKNRSRAFPRSNWRG